MRARSHARESEWAHRMSSRDGRPPFDPHARLPVSIGPPRSERQGGLIARDDARTRENNFHYEMRDE